jgi:hypothetical protein
VTLDEFTESLARAAPPGELSLALQSLWWMKNGDWNQAHALIDDADGADECWVHAHLHRVEGDLANAGYWYRRAGKPAATGALETERDEIAVALLG